MQSHSSLDLGIANQFYYIKFQTPFSIQCKFRIQSYSPCGHRCLVQTKTRFDENLYSNLKTFYSSRSQFQGDKQTKLLENYLSTN